MKVDIVCARLRDEAARSTEDFVLRLKLFELSGTPRLLLPMVLPGVFASGGPGALRGGGGPHGLLRYSDSYAGGGWVCDGLV